MSGYSVPGFLFLRFALTALMLLPALLRSPADTRRATLKTGTVLGAILFGIFLCETFGVAYTCAGHAALLISLSVVFTPLVEWALLRRRPTRGEAISAAR